MSRPGAPYAITPHLLLRAYSIGLFPMAESADDDQLFWVDPEKRAIFPLDTFIVYEPDCHCRLLSFLPLLQYVNAIVFFIQMRE